jgi:hypothetical protein
VASFNSLLRIVFALAAGSAVFAIGVAALKVTIDLPFADQLVPFFMHICEISTGAIIGALGAYFSVSRRRR